MAKNVIILTSGLTGSSVLTGFISQAGLWTGDRTHVKEEYNTYENQELVDLNVDLLNQAGYSGNYMVEFPVETIAKIENLGKTADLNKYREFVAKCNAHQPYIWKDPRLWLTMRFWFPLLNLDNCAFIVLTRSMVQSWVSELLRRRIRTFRHCKLYENRVYRAAIELLEQRSLPYLHIQYDNLIKDPDRTIQRINEHIGTQLTVDDLRRVYRNQLYQSPRRSTLDHIKAGLIYLKNYSQRLDIAPGQEF